jgi:hypothetical protein
VNVEFRARGSKGLSGADLKSVVEEGKLLFAYAVATGGELSPIEEFFTRAIESCLANRRNYRRKASSWSGPSYGFPIG